MRILITGSRDWIDAEAIQEALAEHLTIHDTLVVGDCPTGADALALADAKRMTVDYEVYKAKWSEHTEACPDWCQGRNRCVIAGPRRNQEMVDSGVDVCLAFPLGNSRGTKDCMRRARKSGVPVIEY